MPRGPVFLVVVEDPTGRSWEVRGTRAGLLTIVPGPLWFVVVPLDILVRRFLYRDQWRVIVQRFPQALSRKKVFSVLVATEADAAELVDRLAAQVQAEGARSLAAR